jgi:hypothetical protein
MVLNLKKVDYKTEFVEYPDLVPTLKAVYAHRPTIPPPR